MGTFYMYSYGIRNNASPTSASADAALSCKPVWPVTRGGCGQVQGEGTFATYRKRLGIFEFWRIPKIFHILYVTFIPNIFLNTTLNFNIPLSQNACSNPLATRLLSAYKLHCSNLLGQLGCWLALCNHGIREFISLSGYPRFVWFFRSSI